MSKNYKQIAKEIVEFSGGEKNISSVSHCMTRLRLQINNKDHIDIEKIKNISGVLNVIVQNGEYQIVIGQDVPSLYEEFQLYDVKTIGSVEEDDTSTTPKNKGNKRILNTFFSFIGGTFSPVIPVLVAGGLTGAVLTLLTNFFGVSAESGTYTVFFAINQAAFYFLPIFIGFSAATRLKSNGYLGGFLGGILLYESINNAEGLNFFGLPVAQVVYNSTVFPILLGVLFMSIVYKFLQKHVPIILRTILVPLLTILITVPVTLIILGPVGDFLGKLLANGVYAIYQAVPSIAVMIVGITTPLMVFFGMNNATYPIVFALLAEVGADPLICTGMAPANVAVGGACLAAGLITKNVEQKSVSISAGVTALCGITEPGVYGVLFPKRYPLIGAMIGGGIGGLIAGLLGMKQYVVSTPGFISFPAYIDPSGSNRNILVSMFVMIVAVIIGFGATYLLGKRTSAKEGIIVADNEIVALDNANQIPIESVNDTVFSSKTLGDGIAFELKQDLITAPVNGTLSVLYPTGHAFGMTMDNGVELLCHIGINTVESKGKGFKILAKQGDKVKAGDSLVEVDLKQLSKEYDMTTMLVITNENNKKVQFFGREKVKRGDKIGEII